MNVEPAVAGNQHIQLFIQKNIDKVYNEETCKNKVTRKKLKVTAKMQKVPSNILYSIFFI